MFLDRDGVLNRKALPNDYVKDWGEFSWLPGARDAVARLGRAGARVLIATNQQGVARGLIRPAALADLHARLVGEVEAAGGRIAGVYVCPHLAGTCDCRKPLPGLFYQARRDFPDIAFNRAVMVGDSPLDIEAGRGLGMRTVQVARAGVDPVPEADAHAADLADAVDRYLLPWIVGDMAGPA